MNEETKRTPQITATISQRNNLKEIISIESKQVIPHKVASNGVLRQPETHQIDSNCTLVKISIPKTMKISFNP